MNVNKTTSHSVTWVVTEDEWPDTVANRKRGARFKPERVNIHRQYREGVEHDTVFVTGPGYKKDGSRGLVRVEARYDRGPGWYDPAEWATMPEWLADLVHEVTGWED